MTKLKDHCLVTGGAGFIGSHLAKALLDLGYRVTVLDDLSGGFRENVPEGAEFVQGSITDTALLSRLFEERRFGFVFHMAAYAAEGLSHFIKRFNYINNVVGSVNLINESVKHKVKCFVFSSSFAVYGNNPLPFSEEQTPMPEDSYGIAKLAVEMELKVTRQMFGMEYIIFRLHNVYGEHQNIGDRYRNVVGIFMNNILQGKPLVIFGDGHQTRAFTYIDDVAGLIAASIEQPACYGGIFNAGTEAYTSINELARTVNTAMASQAPIIHVEERNEVKHAYGAHAKLRDIFGKQANIPLEEGIGRMARWAKAAGARRSKEFKDIEIYEKLPAVWAQDNF